MDPGFRIKRVATVAYTPNRLRAPATTGLGALPQKKVPDVFSGQQLEEQNCWVKNGRSSRLEIELRAQMGFLNNHYETLFWEGKAV